MEKIVIIGGGVAGLALCGALKKQNQQVKIFERRAYNHNDGLALLLLPNGMEAFKKMNLEQEVLKKVNPLKAFESLYSTGKQIASERMSNLFGAKRGDLINILRDQLAPGDIKYGHEFSHFSFDSNGRAFAAHFSNGHIEKADVFIAADGGNSQIRKLLFPESKISNTGISEIVSIIKAPDLVRRLNGSFQKTICKSGGRALGLLGCSKEEVVWFFQYDESVIEFNPSGNFKNFLKHQVGSWASFAEELLIRTDFNNSYLWKTHDMDPLRSYSKNNICLIGDAAHVFNTMTSQGVNTALEDGIHLSNLLMNKKPGISFSEIFELFYSQRKALASSHLLHGRSLNKQFKEIQNRKMEMPMVLS